MNGDEVSKRIGSKLADQGEGRVWWSVRNGKGISQLGKIWLEDNTMSLSITRFWMEWFV